ncbi:hypothetical protein HpBT131_10720 [Helicobacter pylori]
MIEKLQKAIAITIDREIDPTIKEIRDKLPETYSNLDRSRDKFVSNLGNSVHNEIDRFKSDLREKMYAHIDRDIEDYECKRKFIDELQKGMKELDRTIEGLVKECEKQFSKDIKEDIGQFEERIKNSLVMLNRINIDSGFDPNFNIHRGNNMLNTLGLLSSIASLVFGLFNFWNPIGWASIGLGLIGIVKSVWSWFSSDYKKSQQKEAVNKNLDKVCEEIEEEMRNQLKSYKKVMFEKVEDIKVMLNDPVVCYERMREGLIKAGEGLWQIDNNIKTRIAQ